MDWSTNENDSETIANSNHHQQQHHDEFANLNTNNYDTNLNLNLSQLSQLISLNSNQDLISATDAINNGIELLQQQNNSSNLGRILKISQFY